MLWGSAWAMAGHDKDTLPLSTAEIQTLPWALQGYCGVGHCRDTLLLGAAGMLCGSCWSMQGNCAVIGHCRDTWLGTAGILTGCALLGYPAVGHCKDTLWLGTAGILGRHCRDPLRVGTSGIITQRLVTAGIFGGWALQ